MSKPISMLCIYHVRKGNEEEFKRLLKRHWPALNKAGLVSTEPPKVVFGVTKSGKGAFIETFQWKDAKAPATAHQTPEVMAVWEPMGALVEEMEFLQVEPVKL